MIMELPELFMYVGIPGGVVLAGVGTNVIAKARRYFTRETILLQFGRNY